MITLKEKTEIRDRLEEYCSQKGSQNKAANSLRDVSAATISKLLNGEWELINETMWRHIGNQIGVKNKNWNIVETSNYRDLNTLFADAQDNSLVMAICCEAGAGKTLAANMYAEQHREVFLMTCSDYWNRKIFMEELLRVMGKNANGDTIGEMMRDVVRSLKRMNNPLLILDEADKLTDQALYFFITLYNQLEDCCGIILMATDYLEKKIKRGLRLNKKGYKEIYSRVGRKFVSLRGLSSNDITDVCTANGVNDKAEIKEVIKDCEGDLRRVKRKCFAINRKRLAQEKNNESQSE